MPGKYLKYQFQNSSICGVYCYLSSDGKKVFHAVRVDHKKGSLSFEVLGEIADNIGELCKLTHKLPVYLVLDGKGVLLKKIVPEPDQLLIKQLIPTAREDEFVVDSYPGGNESLNAAIARVELINEIATELKNEGLNIICLSIGPFRTANLIRYFNELPDELSTGGCRLKYNKSQKVLSEFDRNNNHNNVTYTIDSKQVEAGYLPALSVALEYYIEQDQECDFKEIRELKREFLSKIQFQTLSIAAMLFIFTILLINMFLYTYYNDKKQKVENQLVGNKNILNTLDTLKREVEWKENFMREAGIIKNTRMAFYADRIAETVPEVITLEKLEIHPVAGKIRSNKEITLKPNTVLVEGFTKNSSFLNGWIHKLKDLEWIENVAIINYLQEDELIPGTFSLELKIKELKP